MNTAHWHLLLNHAPVISIVIGLLILIAGYVLKNEMVKKTALAVFVFAALSAIPAFLTGEGAEEAVENLPGITDNIIDKHEDIGSVFLWLIGGLGVIALGALLADFFRHKLKNTLYIVALIGAVISIGVAKQLATTGGEIRHTEIRADAQTSITATDKDDDD